MCTSARLVQADNVSEWYGMSHQSTSASRANIVLVPDVAAYLEVTIDPAAHGDAGLGRVVRAVMVETAGGQRFQFVLTADVVR
jgi:hypothetical protein